MEKKGSGVSSVTIVTICGVVEARGWHARQRQDVGIGGV
jgi:hypothetical protein